MLSGDWLLMWFQSLSLSTLKPQLSHTHALVLLKKKPKKDKQKKSAQPWTRPQDRAISRIAASFSSCGKTCWIAKFLLKLIKKSSKQSFFLPWDFGVAASSDLFLYCETWPLFDLLALCCNLIFSGSEERSAPRTASFDFSVVVVAAAAATAIAFLAFLCRIPHALQSDCTTIFHAKLSNRELYKIKFFMLKYHPQIVLINSTF